MYKTCIRFCNEHFEHKSELKLRICKYSYKQKTFVLNFFGADFCAPKSGHRCGNQSALGHAGLEVLACSLNNDLNYVTTMFQLCPSMNHEVMLWHFFGCVLIDRYCNPSTCFLVNPRPSAEFLGKIHKFLRSLADLLSVLAFFGCHYIFDSYVTCLTLSFNTVYV